MLSPPFLVVDFEMAAMNAIRRTFTASVLKGCLFHFTQCLYRKMQKAHLQTRYAEDPDFSLKMRMLFALAFLPDHQIRAVSIVLFLWEWCVCSSASRRWKIMQLTKRKKLQKQCAHGSSHTCINFLLRSVRRGSSWLLADKHLRHCSDAMAVPPGFLYWKYGADVSTCWGS